MMRAARGGPVLERWRRPAAEIVERREVLLLVPRREAGFVVVSFVCRDETSTYVEATFHEMVRSPAHGARPGAFDVWPRSGLRAFRVEREVWIAYTYLRAELEREIAADLEALGQAASGS
jgi:hypothetical protein